MLTAQCLLLKESTQRFGLTTLRIVARIVAIFPVAALINSIKSAPTEWLQAFAFVSSRIEYAAVQS